MLRSSFLPIGKPWSWYIVNFYVPMLVVSQVMIIYYLLTRPETA